MEIPLVLSRRKDGAVVYAIPLWYRLAMAAMLAVVAASVLSSGEAPSLGAWIVFALLALGILYEERWTVDPQARRLSHRGGILPFAATLSLPFEEIELFRIVALARGTIPGTEDERHEKERAFDLLESSVSGAKGLGLERRGFLRPSRMPYLNLIAVARDGQPYLIDSLPASRAKRLLRVGRVFSEACGVPFEERESDAAQGSKPNQ